MSLRSLFSVLAMLVLSACIGTQRAPEPPVLQPDPMGLQPTLSQLRIDFGRSQAGVIDTVSRLLGEGPQQIATSYDCGAGPITAASWSDGLTLNFQDGRFAGWVSTDPDLPTPSGFRPGQPRLEMPPVSFQVTSLGTEFARGDLYGLLTEDEQAVRLLWAGVTCFFR